MYIRHASFVQGCRSRNGLGRPVRLWQRKSRKRESSDCTSHLGVMLALTPLTLLSAISQYDSHDDTQRRRQTCSSSNSPPCHWTILRSYFLFRLVFRLADLDNTTLLLSDLVLQRTRRSASDLCCASHAWMICCQCTKYDRMRDRVYNRMCNFDLGDCVIINDMNE